MLGRIDGREMETIVNTCSVELFAKVLQGQSAPLLNEQLFGQRFPGAALTVSDPSEHSHGAP